MTPKIQIGDIVHCIFLDHSQDATDVMEFEVFGRVTAVTRQSYKIHCWRYVSDVDRAADDNRDANEDCYSIVRRAIRSIRKLK